MIRDFPPSTDPVGPRIGKELAALAASSVLFPLGFWQPQARTVRQKEQRTIVMIHGYMANHSALFPLATYLRLASQARVFVFNYSATRGIAGAAIALKDYLQKHVRGGRIDLVCHSLGGLVARFYLQELGGARRVDRCITLATPHQGTYNAYWVPSRIGRELRPDSALIERLNASRERAAGIAFSSIVAGSDNIVVPRVFAGHEELVCYPDLGHISMLFSLRVFRAVATRLNAAVSRPVVSAAPTPALPFQRQPTLATRR